MSVVRHEKPKPFKGSFTAVNECEVTRLRKYSVKELINSITNAQTIIDTNIGNHDVKEIAYKCGSRSYTPLEHLSIVARHIEGHLKDLRKIKYEDFEQSLQPDSPIVTVCAVATLGTNRANVRLAG